MELVIRNILLVLMLFAFLPNTVSANPNTSNQARLVIQVDLALRDADELPLIQQQTLVIALEKVIALDLQPGHHLSVDCKEVPLLKYRCFIVFNFTGNLKRQRLRRDAVNSIDINGLINYINNNLPGFIDVVSKNKTLTENNLHKLSHNLTYSDLVNRSSSDNQTVSITNGTIISIKISPDDQTSTTSRKTTQMRSQQTTTLSLTPLSLDKTSGSTERIDQTSTSMPPLAALVTDSISSTTTIATSSNSATDSSAAGIFSSYPPEKQSATTESLTVSLNGSMAPGSTNNKVTAERISTSLPTSPNDLATQGSEKCSFGWKGVNCKVFDKENPAMIALLIISSVVVLTVVIIVPFAILVMRKRKRIHNLLT